MLIRIGYDIAFESPAPVPMLALLRVHPDRAGDLAAPDEIQTDQAVPVDYYLDAFGNRCARLVLPAGRTVLSTDALIADSGLPDPVVPDAPEIPVADLPPECLVYLLGSRYCETDRMVATAWSLFGATPPGWARVQAICDYVHRHVQFGYRFARATRGASEAHDERTGVCRDFAHLAVTFCRCMNIPARYVTGYLGDIGVPADPAPMDFSAWFEVFLGGRWHAFDARHNRPRIGRIVIGRGRDAADVAITNSFGPAMLSGFRVWTDEVAEFAVAAE